VPVYHIYGSEELSSLAPGVAELSPKPYAALNPDDAERFRIKKDEGITLSINGQSINLPVNKIGIAKRFSRYSGGSARNAEFYSSFVV